jgi:integrase
LVALYYASPQFKRLKPITKSTYRNVIEAFREAHGDKPVKGLEQGHVKAIIAAKSETPVAANNLLGMLRMLMKLAIEEKWRTDDPTAGVKNLKRKSVQGFRTWSEEEIATFEAKFALGTRAHLAFQLLLHTGQRRADVVRMGRQHIRDGVLAIRQSKTGTEVTLPVHPNLQAAIDALPKDQLTFLMTAQGRPFTPAGFTNWFRGLVGEAGLPGDLSPHGLRKALSRRLAEAGSTPHEIMAVTGHKNLAEVTLYTEAANRVRSAATAMGVSGTKVTTPQSRVGNSAEKLSNIRRLK